MGHREILLSLPATLDQLPPNCSPTTRASVRRTTASFKSGFFHEKAAPVNLDTFFGRSSRNTDRRPTGGAKVLASLPLIKVLIVESPRFHPKAAPVNLDTFFGRSSRNTDRRPTGGAKVLASLPLIKVLIVESPRFHPHSWWSCLPRCQLVSSIANGCCHLGTELNYLCLQKIYVPNRTRSHPNSTICHQPYLSYRACGPRNFMKIAQSRSQNRRGSERRDRSLSGEVEAVYLSDPERAWLSE